MANIRVSQKPDARFEGLQVGIGDSFAADLNDRQSVLKPTQIRGAGKSRPDRLSLHLTDKIVTQAAQFPIQNGDNLVAGNRRQIVINLAKGREIFDGEKIGAPQKKTGEDKVNSAQFLKGFPEFRTRPDFIIRRWHGN